MLMSCIDLLAKNGKETLAVLDLGGGATSERVAEGIRILLNSAGAKILFINIFGGITRCDEIANGIALAREKYGFAHPVVVRFEGTNKQKGLDIIQSIEGVQFADDLLSEVLDDHAVEHGLDGLPVFGRQLPLRFTLQLEVVARPWPVLPGVVAAERLSQPFGVVTDLAVDAGAAVTQGAVLCEIK